MANKLIEIWPSFFFEKVAIKNFTTSVISKRTKSELGLVALAFYNPGYLGD